MPGTVYIIANAKRVVRKCCARVACFWLAAQRLVEQQQYICSMHLTLLTLMVLTGLLSSSNAWAVPSNFTIVNTVNADYQVNGTAFNYSSSVNLVTDNNAGNSAPSGIDIDALEVDENASGAIISDVFVEDLDPSDSHTLVVSDTRFEIVGGKLKLVDGLFLDFENEPSVGLVVTVTDSEGASYSQAFTLTVLDVNEAPENIDLQDSNFPVNTPGATIGLLSATDPDVGDTFIYGVSDDRFEVVGSELRLRDGVSIPLGTTVDLEITVTDAGGLTFSKDFVLEFILSSEDSQIEFLILANGFSGNGTVNPENLPVAVSQCSLSQDAVGLYAESPVPNTFQGRLVAVPSTLDLLPTGLYKSGETAFFKLNDADANLDPLGVDFVVARLSSSVGDEEIIRFFETGTDTGIFSGYVQTSIAMVIANDCKLSGGENTTITIEYTNAFDSTDTSSASALLDPVSIVFASGTGQAISGARITLVDVITGQPAEITGDDAVSVFPNSIVSGGSEASYQFSDGSYRFPYLMAGQYILIVEPPNRFVFPSQVANSELQTLPGAPYQLPVASRGETLVLGPSSVFQVDIPLDLVEISPSISNLELYVSSNGILGSDGLLTIGTSQCRMGDVFQVQPDPVTPAGSIELPANFTILAAETVQLGDAVFVRVVDRDQDAEPFAADQITVTVQISGSGDMEQLILTETGDSTGIFTGYIQTTLLAGENFDCALNAQAGDVFEVEYVDVMDESDISSLQARIQRTFRAFDSSTGELLDGARITLIDEATGQAARVLSEDGVSVYPSTVISGDEVVDSSGNRFTFMPGEFRFPFVDAGSYRFSIIAPISYVFPSSVSDNEIQQLADASFRLTPASRGDAFVVETSGRPETFDVPLDPIAAEIFVSKIASKQSVSVGDFIQYQISVENPHSSGTVSELTLVDLLPAGFRLVERSAYFNGNTPAPSEIAADGRTLSFPVSDLGPQSSFTLKYVAQVTAGANRGNATNSAYLAGRGVGASNTATASVLVGEDLLQSKATIIGRITTGGCGAEATGFASGRIFLEDGSYVLSDNDGRFHFEGVEPGTHVVQLDVGSLPESQQVISCDEGNVFAGTDFSQFVDLQAGSLWRADFYLGERAALLEKVTTRLNSEFVEDDSHGRTLKLSYKLVSEGIQLSDLKSIVMLPDELDFVEGSAQLNGKHIEDPQGSEFNTLTFRMADSEGAESRELSFKVFASQAARDIQIKAVTLFQADSKPVRTKVLKNTVRLGKEEWRLQKTAVGKKDENPDSNDLLMRDFGVVEITRDRKVRIGSRFEIPELKEDKIPRFDTAWLALQDPGTEIIWPVEKYNPRIPTTNVYVKHSIGDRVLVLVGGVEVNPLSFEGLVVVPTTSKSISKWRNVSLESGSNIIEVHITDSNDTLTVLKRLVHYSGSPIRAELVSEASQLEADGLTPAVVAVKFYDRDGYPVRPGLTGSFSIEEPFSVLNQALLQSQIDPNIGAQDSEKYLVRRDGIAYIQLEPTSETGEVNLRFEFGNNRFDEVKARLVPAQRDWVVVGFGEGSLAYNRLTGNMVEIDDAGIDHKLGSAGRVAFYAKGKISGRWLMTIAYDSDKRHENSLGQQIDPNKYYTLYGDGSEQRYDAQSQRKLYLKIENEDFRILFGDYDTSFDDSELSRYNRRFNGFKNELSGDKWRASVFAAKTDLAHIRDEMRGDGTSGIYHLSRTSLVSNSESVVIETRDRFRSEVIINQKPLSRFVDYTINYITGSIIFKRPVYSQDSNLNPNVIIVEYEVAGLGQGDAWVAGGRVTHSFDEDKAKLSATYIQDNTQGGSGKLMGTDLQWQVNSDNRIIAEVAHSDTQLAGEGSAYILQLEHQSQKMAGKVYFRQQDKEFGMGQQNAVEAGTRKIGAEGEYRASEGVQFRALLYKQSNLQDVSERTVAEMRAEYRLEKTAVNAGLRAVEEQNSTGESGAARQLTLGASHALLDRKLQLSSNAEIDIGSGNSTDFPTRLLLEADYELMAGVQLLAEQELSWSKTRNTSDSRLGIEAQPWTGANISSFVQRNGGENGNRLMATTGVLQQWRIRDNWLFDLGFDRVHTLDKENTEGESARNPELGFSLNSSALSATAFVPVSGSFNNDFVAAFVGLGYRQENWDVSSRLEFHKGDVVDKWNVLMGASHQLSEGRVLSGSVSVLREEQSLGSETLRSDVRFGLAWRPDSSDWIFLNRLDWIYSSQEDGVFDIKSNKLVDNFNANLRINKFAQLSIQLGFKYVLDQIDRQKFRAFTALAGSELRYDITPRWDVGMRASYLYSVGARGATENARYSYGLSVGHNPAKNLWLSVGYNLQGFRDEDFFAADYTARGWYLSFRFKVDQESMRSFLSYAGRRSGIMAE